MTPLKTFKCSFPFRNISIPGSEPSVARELRSNSFPHFSFSSAQLHDVWLGGASVLGSHLAGEPSAGAYVFALRGRSSAYATFVRTSNIFSVLPFVRTCTICLHMQHLTAPAQFYRLRSDFLLPPPAFPQRFSVSWTPASSSRYSDGLALQLAPDIFLFSSSLLLPPFSV